MQCMKRGGETSKIAKELKSIENTIKKQIAIVEKNEIPDITGSLKIIRRGRNIHYSFQHFDSDRGKYVCTYIKDNNLDLAKQIALRDYYKKLHKVLKNQLAKVQIALANPNIEINNCYLSMDEGKRMLISPIQDSIQSKINAWRNEQYEINRSHPETLIHPTDRGEFVRSKSEEIIANYLFSKSDVIDYKYERPLSIVVSGKKAIIHPDFTIINLKTGTIYILEHVSRLDLPEYHDAFVFKHRAYIENGMYQNGRIIYSFESAGQPLNMKEIKILINEIVLEDI